MITDQYNEIMAIMDTLKGAGQPFSEVFSWPDPMPKTFPIAIVNMEEGDQRDESSNIKILTNDFLIRCCFRQKDTSAAYLQRSQVADQVYNAFTVSGVADYLNGTATKMDIKHKFFITDTADQPIFGVDFFIKTELIMQVS